MSNVLVSTTGANGDTKSTGRDIKSTEHDTKSTEHDILTTLGDTSAHDAKVDLRRIVCDFLTVRNRVGDAVFLPRFDLYRHNFQLSQRLLTSHD